MSSSHCYKRLIICGIISFLETTLQISVGCRRDLIDFLIFFCRVYIDLLIYERKISELIDLPEIDFFLKGLSTLGISEVELFCTFICQVQSCGAKCWSQYKTRVKESFCTESMQNSVRESFCTAMCPTHIECYK